MSLVTFSPFLIGLFTFESRFSDNTDTSSFRLIVYLIDPPMKIVDSTFPVKTFDPDKNLELIATFCGLTATTTFSPGLLFFLATLICNPFLHNIIEPELVTSVTFPSKKFAPPIKLIAKMDLGFK